LSYIRGKQYESEKLNVGRPKDNCAQSAHFKTADRLAVQHKIDPATIRRDAQYANAVDTIAENCGGDARDIILSHDARITRKDVIGLMKKPPTFQRTIMTKIISSEAKDIRMAKRQVKRERTESQVEACQDRMVDGWYQGDWRDHIGKLTDRSVSLLLTEPPYDQVYQGHRKRVRNDPIAYDAVSEQAAMELEALLMAINPKLTVDAHLLIFCTWRSELSIRIAIENAGYVVRGILVWVKNRHESGTLCGAFTPKYEHIIHAVKGNPLLIKPMGDVIVVVKDLSDRHPTEKPIDLLRPLIEATTVEGTLVTDPFGGVASTCVAAYLSGRQYWGCEIDAGYYAAGMERLNDEL